MKTQITIKQKRKEHKKMNRCGTGELIKGEWIETE